MDKLWDKIVEEYNNIRNGVQGFIDSVVSWINNFTSWIPGIGRLIQQAIDAIVDFANRVWDLLQQIWDAILRVYGSPWTLYQNAAKWTDVGQTVQEQAGLVAASNLATDNTWDGRSGEAYRECLPPQSNAIAAYGAGVALLAAEGLRDGASSIINTWVEVLKAIAMIAGGVAVAVAAGITLVGIPAAIATLIGACISAIATLYSAELQGFRDFQEIAAKFQTASSNPAYPGGQWPKTSNVKAM